MRPFLIFFVELSERPTPRQEVNVNSTNSSRITIRHRPRSRICTTHFHVSNEHCACARPEGGLPVNTRPFSLMGMETHVRCCLRRAFQSGCGLSPHPDCDDIRNPRANPSEQTHLSGTSGSSSFASKEIGGRSAGRPASTPS